MTSPDMIQYKLTHPFHHRVPTEVELSTCNTSSTDLGDFRIIVLTYNRPKSLKRLLESLEHAEYYGDKINIEVWIDRSKEGIIDEGTLKVARNFSFSKGQRFVKCHNTHVGIIGQWIDTWNPGSNSSEVAVILEDDLTVSKYFYKWLKLVHRKYDSFWDINGYALQGVSIKHSGGGGYVEAPKDCLVYRYPTLGTWGFSPNNANWLKFKKWFSEAYTDASFKPFVPNHVATEWYKVFIQTDRAEGMWEMWHIFFAWKNNETSLYSNLGGHQGLAINHREAGLHYSGSEAGRVDPLLTEWKQEYENLPENPISLDNSGKVISLSSSLSSRADIQSSR